MGNFRIRKEQRSERHQRVFAGIGLQDARSFVQAKAGRQREKEKKTEHTSIRDCI